MTRATVFSIFRSQKKFSGPSPAYGNTVNTFAGNMRGLLCYFLFSIRKFAFGSFTTGRRELVELYGIPWNKRGAPSDLTTGR